MSAFIIYDQTTGEVKRSYTLINHSDDAAAIAANTPEGCAAMEVSVTDPVIHDQRGWVVQDGALTLIAPTDGELLTAAQSVQSALIEAAYQNAAYNTAVPYMGTTFWADQDSQTKITGALVALGPAGPVPEGFAWWTAENTSVPMTFTDLKGLSMVILLNVNTCFVKRKALLATIAAATTVLAVQAVVW